MAEQEEIGLPAVAFADSAFADAEGVGFAPGASVEIRWLRLVELVPEPLETVLRPAMDLDRSPGMTSLLVASVPAVEELQYPQKRLVERLRPDCSSG